MNPYRAIVVGGTGAVGGALVRELGTSPLCGGVTSIGRRSVEGKGAKVTQRIVALEALQSVDASGHEVAFCTLGVGQPRKIPAAEHWKVDVESATAFARACRRDGVRHISLLTSVGADAGSRSRYLRVKGAVEKNYRELGFERLSFFRPSLLVTPDIRCGLQDRISQIGFPLLSWAMPGRFHQIRVEDLGRAMRINAERDGHGVEILEYPDFVRLLQ